MWRQMLLSFLISGMMLGLVGVQGIAAEGQTLEAVTLQIDGMTCGACVKDVKAALANVPGVNAVEITVGKKWLVFSDYANARAAVTFNPEKSGVEALVKAVETAGNALSTYQARVLKSK